MFLLLIFLPSICASWSLEKKLDGGNFFDGSYWNWWTGDDPTHGYVNYVDKGTASSNGYISTSGPSVPTYMGCDHTHAANGRGRNSVRISSKKSYSYGLFLLYLNHMPTGCGTWPAWWTVGPNWPNGGEIDIIEQVNTATNDQSTLHTGSGCDFGAAPKNYTGTTLGNNCLGNNGCGIQNRNGKSFGGTFNSAGGGLFAMQWTDWGISMWFWNEGSIPSDPLNSNNPNTLSWGIPYAQWQFGSWCPASHFVNQQVIFDLTFCGDWCGAVFASQCPGKGDCNGYVQNNAGAFGEAYWDIHWMKVFQ